jgi:hypothetical protein
MKKTLIIALASILMLMISCKDNTLNNQFLLENSGYIPLQVGNEWFYKHVTSSDTTEVFIKIIDSININNIGYYIIKNSNPELINPYIGQDTTVYLRTLDGITYFQYFENVEYIHRVFKDTTISEDELTPKMVNYHDTQNSTHPVLGSGLTFIRTEVGGGSEPLIYDYAKGYGLVNFWWFKGYCKLVHAKVNDIIYE